MFRTCPYCGGRLETIGGPDGNPFHAKRKAVDVCKSCGSRIHAPGEEIVRLLRIHARAAGGGSVQTAVQTVPFSDGVHGLGSEYPFRRQVEGKPADFLCSVTIQGEEIRFAGQTFRTEQLPGEIVLDLTAYGYDKCPVQETSTLTISEEIDLQV